jgi:hypothetical protein
MADWNFNTITVRHGTPARRDIDVTWSDKTPRDLSGLTGYLRVYDSPGGALLFPEVTLADGEIPSRRVLTLTAAQCTQAGSSYYAEIEFRDGSGNPAADAGWYGTLKIVGR